MDVPCRSQEEVLAELQAVAPEAPFLALGQTVFWDEPVKVGVALRSRELGHTRRFVAGIHDTDYFAKFKMKGKSGGYVALPHNDTSTKGLWSAAGEFSALFGSETVVTKESLQAAGANVGRIQAERPGYLDEITEAWGWRGVVSLDPAARITAEKQLGPLYKPLNDSFAWAVETSLKLIAGPHRIESEAMADRLRSMACDAGEGAQALSLTDYYERLLVSMHETVSGSPSPAETTRTSELLRFNSQTCGQPRFDLLRLFVEPATASSSKEAYNAAIAGTEIYPLERFGAGALPFDLYVPGVGRGTLRLGTKGGVVMAPNPVGFSYKKRPETVDELAALIERRFGADCVLVGKAVTLIGMLAREFVFVFHEGASSYVRHSRSMHQKLAEFGHNLKLNPILRVGLEPWDALADCCAWFKLPEPLRRPFGTDETSGCSFAARWREVQAKQRALLIDVSTLRRPLELVRFLDQAVGGQWSCIAARYESMHDQLVGLNRDLNDVRSRKSKVRAAQKSAKEARQQAEVELGRHWREKIFEKEPTEADWTERRRLQARLERAKQDVLEAKAEWTRLQAEHDAIVASEDVDKARTERHNVALEAELARAALVREATVAAEGLTKSGHRPSAWWFALVCPDGTWFRSTMRRAKYWLEPLT